MQTGGVCRATSGGNPVHGPAMRDTPFCKFCTRRFPEARVRQRQANAQHANSPRPCKQLSGLWAMHVFFREAHLHPVELSTLRGCFCSKHNVSRPEQPFLAYNWSSKHGGREQKQLDSSEPAHLINHSLFFLT